MKVSKSKHYSIEKTTEGKITGLHITIDEHFSLFRYRAVNKYTTEQFINDDLVATSPAAFNDPYDATVRFSIRKIKQHIKTKLIANKAFLKRLLKINKLKSTQINILVDLIYQRDLSPNINFNNNVYAFSCFSTDVTQEIMWAHYANLATGFALEYDYKELCEMNLEHQNRIMNLVTSFEFLQSYSFQNDLIQYPLLPIIYQNEKYDVTDDYIEYIDSVLDKIDKYGVYNPINLSLELLTTKHNSKKMIDFVQNVYFRKKMPWNYENEWRLICYNFNVFVGQISNNYVTVGKITPKAVYLGEKMSEFDKKAIIEIAFNKGIDVYQMQTSFAGKTLKLRPIKIVPPKK